MNLVLNLKRIVPMPIKQFLKKYIKRNRLIQIVSPHLAECICIDVGASYYPHVKWQFLLESTNTQWIAVEPNERNIDYIHSWKWASKVKAITTGLSREGGLKTLYVTNVDSGSSLLEPVITKGMSHRIKGADLEYFFPVRTVEIDTITLPDVIENEPIDTPVFVKLDTQGSELSILEGAHELLKKNRIVGIEMESTLLAQPFMKGSKKFWEACQYLEGMGFELLDITPIRAPSKTPFSKRYLNECDAVFALRRDIAQALPINYRVSLFSFYLTNNLFEEAMSLLDEDAEVRIHFTSQQVDLHALSKIIFSLM